MAGKMTARCLALFVAAVFISPFANVARADDAATNAKALNDTFNQAFEACNIPAVLALYEDNAVMIWPGQGEFAIGKPGIEKIVRGYCSAPSKPSIKVISSDARRAGLDYIIHFGQLDTTITGPDGKPTTYRIRTSELLHKSHGKWRYEVDHASAGLQLPDASKTP